MVAGAHRSLSGRGEVEAEAGQVVTVNPGEVHDGRPIGERPRRWSMAYFDGELVEGLWRETSSANLAFNFANPVVSSPMIAQRVRDLINRFAARHIDALAAEELLPDLLAELSSVPRPQTSVGVPRSLQRVKALIDDEPERVFSLADLSREAGLSRYETVRAFRRAYDISPYAYLLDRRLMAVRSAILAGESLAIAAQAAGFADQSHMHRMFVGRYGYTPGALARAR